MERKDKQNYYLDIAEAVVTRGTCLRRNFGAILSRMMKLFPRAIQAPPEAEKTVPIWGAVSERIFRCREGSVMNYAVLFMRRQTVLSAQNVLI